MTLKQGNRDVKTRFLGFDLFLGPTTLTYNPNLARVKVDPHTKNHGQRSNGSAVRTDGQTLPSALSSCFTKASLSIKVNVNSCVNFIVGLRLLDTFALKIAKICDLKTFWPFESLLY